MEVLSSALTSNKSLKTLVLTNRGLCGDTISLNSITEIGWGALSKILRDSNHTLKEVTDSKYPEREMSHRSRQHWRLPDLV